jgi:hypothetical protein
MANLSADTGGSDERGGSQDNSLRNVAKRATNISLPGLGAANNRPLFIFSEENFIRKYARMIIEWGYPFYGDIIELSCPWLHVLFSSRLLVGIAQSYSYETRKITSIWIQMTL